MHIIIDHNKLHLFDSFQHKGNFYVKKYDRIFALSKEQPLLLEELLEQEKREQARHIGAVGESTTSNNQLISDQVCFNFLNLNFD